MKRLLLFILVLFGSMSVVSLSNGCMAQVCTCPNGGYVSYGEYCAVYDTPTQTIPNAPEAPAVRRYLLKLALDGSKYELIDLKTTDFSTALEKMTLCRNSEICKIVDKRNYSAIVVSEDDRIFADSADTYYKETAKVAEKRAIKNCKNGEELNGNGFRGDGIKGKKCKLVMMLSPDFKLEDKRSGETFELKVTSSI